MKDSVLPTTLGKTHSSPETRYSVCALDCPDACAVVVRVEDGRATRLSGDPTHPVTRGYLCAKVTRYLDRQYSADRILYPMRRMGAKGEGRFERISWDQALDMVAGRLGAVSEEYGPEAILPYSYGGTLGVLQGAGMDRRFFHRLGAARLDRTICSAAGEEGLNRTLGYRVGTDPEQFPLAKLIIAWGANIMGTNVHLWPFIVEARRNGARFLVIDPVKNRTGELADRHYAVNPGSDGALALSLMHVMIREKLHDAEYIAAYTSGFDDLERRAAEYPPERAAALTGIAAEDIAALAREYATTRPAVIRLNYGITRGERGVLATHAVALLPAIAGHWREPGGGMLLSTSNAFPIDRKGVARPDLQLRSPLKREARLVNMSRLASALLELEDPPVKALVVYNSNPAVVAPDQKRVLEGLARPDLFTVVLEQMLTDTARFADIVLPATTFLEHTDLYTAYGHYYLQLAKPALPAPGETRSNFQAFRLLAQRMGFTDPEFEDTEEDVIRTALRPDHPHLAGIDLERLESERFIRLHLAPEGEPYLPFAQGGFKTASGKCELGAELLDYRPPTESRLGNRRLFEKYPLELISAKNDDSLNSTFGHRDRVDQQTATIHLSAVDALAREIHDGDLVRIFNDRGELRLHALVDDSVGAGVVRVPSNRWIGRAPDGYGVNVLTSERLTDAGGAPTFFSCLVQVEREGPVSG